MSRMLKTAACITFLLAAPSVVAQDINTLELRDATGQSMAIQFDDVPQVSATYSPSGVLVHFENANLTFRCDSSDPAAGCLIQAVQGGPGGTPGDIDGDGIADGSDNCPNDYNAGQVDLDQDTIGDVCDPSVGNPPNDRDGDGYENDNDNCPDAYNPDQLDSDSDNVGNACDSTPGGSGGGEASVPSAPTSVSAVAGNGSASISWSAPTDNGGSPITGYRVQMSTNSGSWITQITAGASATSYNKTGLSNGVSYQFRVAAINAVGASTYTTSNTVTPEGGGGGEITGCSGIPTGVTCKDIWGSSIYQIGGTVAGKLPIEIPNGDILTIPLRLTVPSTKGEGGVFWTTFEGTAPDDYVINQDGEFVEGTECSVGEQPPCGDGLPDYAWTMWLSDTPGGSTLLGDSVPESGPCYVRRHPADANFGWTQNPSNGASRCYVGSEVGSVYINFAVYDQIGEIRGGFSGGFDFEATRNVTTNADGSAPERRR